MPLENKDPWHHKFQKAGKNKPTFTELKHPPKGPSG